MSLLLLFPFAPTTAPVFCWSAASAGGLVWSAVDPYKDLWSDWASTSWGAIFDAGFTWKGMSGIHFTATAAGNLSWAVVPPATQNCP